MSREMSEDIRRQNQIAMLPNAEDAEKGFLGSMLHAPARIDEYPDLPAIAFHTPSNAQIWSVMREMSAENKPVDLITLTSKLETLGILQEVGGAAAVTDIYTFVPSAGSSKYYAEIIREKWVRRGVIGLGRSFDELGRDPSRETPEDILAEAERQVIELRVATETGAKETVEQCHDAVMEAVDHIELLCRNRGGIIGLSFGGLHDLDRMTGGMQNGEVITIGGRPSQGKSALLMQIVGHNAVENDISSLVFTLEMPKKNLMLREILARSEVDIQRSRDAHFSKREVDRMMREADRISKSKIFIDDTPGLSTAQFRARARRAKMKHGIKLIAIDYLQIMQGVSKRARENRQLEIAEISGTIKQVAKELNLPVVVAAQIGRDAEERTKQRPRLRDLRESASIEQDTDVAVLIYQLHKDEIKEQEEKNEELPEDARPLPIYNSELWLAKQRNGPTDMVKVRFEKRHTRFHSLTPKLYSNNLEERQQ